MAIPKNRTLPPKDASNFRTALKLYEAKQYKKALKSAEAVLKKHPEHGETLAVKGLILYFLEKKDEAHDYIKKGLTKDLTSYVCWHIHGIYHRQERNYEEACKCYTKALQLDPQNQNIVRDLSLLQMQARQYEGLVTSRKRMLQEKPGFRQNWTALAVAQHMTGDCSAAETTLTSFEQAVKEEIPKTDLENSEVLLYKNRIIYEGGDVGRALQNLEEIKDNVTDRLAVREYRAKYLLELGKLKEAEREYRALIKRNSECVDYYHGLEEALQIKEDNVSLRKLLYARLAEKYPKSEAPKQIPLFEFLTGDDFQQAVGKYLTEKLARGVPSLFSMVRPLYNDPTKRNAIDAFIREKYASQQNGSVAGVDPANQVWTTFFLAQHSSHLGDHEQGLKYIEEAIAHTPTLVELHMVKAKILKRAGDLTAASETMNEARLLDLQDRFINTKTVKYMLRAGEMATAIETVSLFTKNDSSGTGVSDLHDMQALWFLIEQAESYARLGEQGLALKRFHAIFNIFKEFKGDQYDFHYYCPRRGTIRAYLDMIRWEDSLYSDPMYVRAVEGAMKIYFALADRKENPEAAEDEYGDMDEAEKKRALKKAKKERIKELKRLQDNDKESKEKAKDTDPLGRELLTVEDPVAEVEKLWKPIPESSRALESAPAWKIAFELFLRQHKYVLAVQALVKARNAGAEAHWLAASAVRARFHLESDDKTPAALRTVPLMTLPTVAPEGNIAEDNLDAYLDSYVLSSENAPSVLSWARAKKDIDGEKADLKAIGDKLMIGIEKGSIETVREAYARIRGWKCPQVEEAKSLALKLWPRATF
ncbi:N-terminal acetyltransferase A complex subunit Nat1p [Trichomonascus vanleenenianus]|uniref:peptide alpha-N-acetyltransferase complex A subunit NAT1 n=1 Tax=Trichomonascus vanleenenianus TaxID=2268995 RepID=UPI003ECB210E